MKIAGKRVGPAEIEKLLLRTRGITEAAVIGIPDDSKGTAIVAMCVGQAIDPGTMQKTIAMEFGKPFTPKRIYVVRALPKTRNGKIVRRAIRAAYLHTNPGDLSALENPEALNEIRNLNI